MQTPEVARAKALLKKARIVANQTAARLASMTELAGDGAANQWDLLTAETNAALAAQDVVIARANLAIAKRC